MSLKKRFAVAAFLLNQACGGAVEAPDARNVGESPDEPVVVTNADAASHEHRFVCKLETPAAVWTLDCTTLADGGASYFDDTGELNDCRNYVKAAGVGCVPDMRCAAYIDDGSMVEGVCIDVGK